MTRSLRNRQNGVTLIGWIFLLAPLAVVGYAGIRLVPAYLNYTKVAGALDAVKKEYSGGDAATISRQIIRESIAKRFNINAVYSPDLDEVEITKDGQGWTMTANYEHVIPLFYNMSILLKIEKSATIN